MSRLQKKCVCASGFIHLLLFSILVVGPAFFHEDKPEPIVPVMNLVHIADAPSGGSPAVAPTRPDPPPQRPQPQQQRTSQEPRVQAQRPAEPAPARPVRQTPVVDMTPIRSNPQPTRPQPTPPAQDDQIARKLDDIRNSLARQLSSSTRIDAPGGGRAFDDYGLLIKQRYEREWVKPQNLARDTATVEVEIIVARDGTVRSAKVLRRSGIADMDRSIEQAIRIKRLPEFPAGTTDPERTFLIEFQLRASQAR